MALAVGNISTYNSNPSSSSFSWSHNQNTGSDGALIVILAIPSTSVSSVTYGGSAMTLVRQEATSYTTDWSIWRKTSPATGSNTVAVTLSGSSYNSCSGVAYSFTGCSGTGNTGFNNSQAVGQTTSLTISANSMIIAMAIGGNGTSTYIEIPDGTSRTLNYTHGINNYTWGAVSPSLSSGSVTVQGGCTASNIMFAVEIKEAATASVVPQIMTNLFRIRAA